MPEPKPLKQIQLNPKRTIYLTAILLCVAPTGLFSQYSVLKYPVRSGYFPNYFVAINPAFAGIRSDHEVYMGNQRLLGNFSNIATYFFNFNVKISRQVHSSDPFSCLGIYAYNDVEGKYINRSRFYALYAWHGQLTKMVRFAGGFALGGMNYSVKGTSLSGNGSAWAADATLGFCLYGTDFYGGFSINQMLNSKIQPLEEVTVLSPFLNVTGGYTHKFSDILEFTPLVNISYLPKQEEFLTDLLGQFLVGGRYIIAGGIYNTDKISITAGIKKIRISEGNMAVNLTYAFPRKNAGLKTSISELALAYQF